jgi:hypothetical protein
MTHPPRSNLRWSSEASRVRIYHNISRVKMKLPFLAALHWLELGRNWVGIGSELGRIRAMNFMLGREEVPLHLDALLCSALLCYAMRCFQIGVEDNSVIFTVKRTVSPMIGFRWYSKVSNFHHLRSTGQSFHFHSIETRMALSLLSFSLKSLKL